jgi:antirestriction protein
MGWNVVKGGNMQFAELNRLLGGTGLIASIQVKCVECERVFDLTDALESDEWNYGHDCEAE